MGSLNKVIEIFCYKQSYFTNSSILL